jgi:DNA-binding MarR family transcriptional regulator
MVKQLGKKGFLERRAEPGDLRKFRLIVTDAGNEAMREGAEALAVVLSERLRRLEHEEFVAFDRMVKRLAGRNGGGVRR